MQPMIIIVVVKKIINFFVQNVILTKIDFYILEFGQMNANAILNSMIQVSNNVRLVIILGFI